MSVRQKTACIQSRQQVFVALWADFSRPIRRLMLYGQNVLQKAFLRGLITGSGHSSGHR
jgi:hypothetical protein